MKIDKFKASSAMYLINISKYGRLPLEESVKKTIAEVIVEWNTYVSFFLYKKNFPLWINQFRQCMINSHAIVKILLK